MKPQTIGIELSGPERGRGVAERSFEAAAGAALVAARLLGTLTPVEAYDGFVMEVMARPITRVGPGWPRSSK